LFYNLLLNKDIEITKQFPDVPDNTWYAEAVLKLASLGIIDGYPDGSYRPGANVTRAEFVAITVKFTEEIPEVTQVLPFYDLPATHWAYRHIHAAVRYGWAEGYGSGQFAPEQAITRAEVVTLVNRMLKRVADRDFINSHPALLRFDDVPGSYWQFYGIMEAFHKHDYLRVGEAEKWLE